MELPWGWVYQNREFTEKIEKEHRFFLNLWLDSRNKNTKERYSALKSFVLFIEDAMKLCKKKGKYFCYWFLDCVANEDYLLKRKEELKELEEHYDELVRQDEIKANALPTLRTDLFKIIVKNNGILQTDIYKQFNDCLKENIKDELYFLCKNGYVVKEKCGKTFKLYWKKVKSNG